MGEGTDSSDSIKATYEVKYLGRTKVTRKKLTSDAMDTLAERLMAYEESQLMKKLEEQERRQRHSSGASIQVSVTFFSLFLPTCLATVFMKNMSFFTSKYSGGQIRANTNIIKVFIIIIINSCH